MQHSGASPRCGSAQYRCGMTITSRPPAVADWTAVTPPEPVPVHASHKSPHRKRFIRRVTSEGGIIALLSLALYITVGVLLDFSYVTFNGDVTSRLANGFYVLYSRDPHLAAVGFVWNPGTSIVDLVPLLFYPLWPALASHAFAASIASAFCMAGAVYQMRCALAEWGVQRTARLVLVAIMALNAMIVYSGGNGMSEGLYLFTLVATCRYLLRWFRDDDLASLVYAAIALGLCYLARNEAAGPAVASGLAVVVVSFFRRSAVQPRSRRIWAALTDTVIFEIPFFFAFTGWAVVSYIITGQAFGQFTSVYGTSSQLKVSGQSGPPQLLHARILHDVHDILYLAPTLPLVVLVALIVSGIRRDVGVLAPLAVLGGGLGFDALAYIANSIAEWFRYFVTAVPLEVLLVGCIVATRPALIRPEVSPTQHSLPRGRSRTRKWLFGFGSVVVVLLLLLPSAYTTVLGMKNPKVGFEENEHLGFLFFKQHLSKFDQSVPQTWPGMVSLAGYFSHDSFSSGQVVVDNFSGCVPQIIMISSNPQVFVIPNDRDFQRILADPLTFHAHYILDVDPVGNGTLTAINILYPALWKSGAGFAKEVHYWGARGECPSFKLFKVLRHPNQSGG